MKNRLQSAVMKSIVLLAAFLGSQSVAWAEGTASLEASIPGSVTFSVHQITVPPGSGVVYVQLGLIGRYLSEAPNRWDSVGVSLEYEAPPGMLNGEPTITFSRFREAASKGQPGLTDPPSTFSFFHPRQPGDDPIAVFNVANLGDGNPIPFVSGTSREVTFSESVNPVLCRITGYVSSEQPLFETPPNRGFLLAVLEFPVDRGTPGELHVRVPPAVTDGNFLGFSSDQREESGVAKSSIEAVARINARVNPGRILVLKPLEESLDLEKWGSILFFTGLGLTLLLYSIRVLLEQGQRNREGKSP